MTEKQFKALSKSEKVSYLDSLWNKMFMGITVTEKKIAENSYYKFRNLYYKEAI